MKKMSNPPIANPNPLKTRSSSLVVSDENDFRVKRKRYSYPLLSSYKTEIPGVHRLPLSPIKPKQGKAESAATSTAAVFHKPNILRAPKGPVRTNLNRRVSASFLDNKSPVFDIYDPMNSGDEAADDFGFERNRIVRRRKKTEEGIDSFALLPDEMVLKIFGYVGKLGLSNCMLVNHRFTELANDETLWKRADAVCKQLSPESVETIFRRNPAYLRLSRASVASPVGLDAKFKASQLIYLDLSMADVTTAALARILSMCNSLVKCSLEALSLPREVMLAMMSFCSSIETLNLAMCYEVNPLMLSLFLSKSPNLKALNIGCIRHNSLATQIWLKEEVMSIITSLPIGLEKLNISGFVHFMADQHVERLVGRLPRLTDLDLSDSQNLTHRSVHHIVMHLKSLTFLGLSRCYRIPIGAYLLLISAVHLRSVQLFAIFKEQTMSELKAALPQIIFNQEPTSTIARPTVGYRRSTIWGERVRD